MPRAGKICSVAGCPEIVHGSGQCDAHKKAASKSRGGYATRGGGNQTQWRRARARCLRRDLFCVCPDEQHGHGPQCMAPATVADHYPDTKAELVQLGVTDVDALHRLRGLCASCHSKHTAATTPGGWNRRDYA